MNSSPESDSPATETSASGAAAEATSNTLEGTTSAAYGTRRSSHQRSHRGDSSGHRRRSQRLVLALALGATLVMLVVVILFSVIRIGGLVSDNDTLSADLFQAQQELATIKPQLESLRKELGRAAEGRLPHLRPLTPDKVIELDSGYVKNIVFTLLRSGNGTRYEFRLVTENKTDALLRPEVRVFLFDQRGVQVGSGEIADRADMVPGESRSYSSEVERFMDEEPRYFYVWSRNGKKTEGGR